MSTYFFSFFSNTTNKFFYKNIQEYFFKYYLGYSVLSHTNNHSNFNEDLSTFKKLYQQYLPLNRNSLVDYIIYSNIFSIFLITSSSMDCLKLNKNQQNFFFLRNLIIKFLLNISTYSDDKVFFKNLNVDYIERSKIIVTSLKAPGLQNLAKKNFFIKILNSKYKNTSQYFKISGNTNSSQLFYYS
jgi:hypothetical protein